MGDPSLGLTLVFSQLQVLFYSWEFKKKGRKEEVIKRERGRNKEGIRKRKKKRKEEGVKRKKIT